MTSALVAVEEDGQKPAEFAQAFGTRTFNGVCSGTHFHGQTGSVELITI